MYQNPPIIMVQWKMGVSPIGSLPFKHPAIFHFHNPSMIMEVRVFKNWLALPVGNEKINLYILVYWEVFLPSFPTKVGPARKKLMRKQKNQKKTRGISRKNIPVNHLSHLGLLSGPVGPAPSSKKGMGNNCGWRTWFFRAIVVITPFRGQKNSQLPIYFWCVCVCFKNTPRICFLKVPIFLKWILSCWLFESHFFCLSVFFLSTLFRSHGNSGNYPPFFFSIFAPRPTPRFFFQILLCAGSPKKGGQNSESLARQKARSKTYTYTMGVGVTMTDINSGWLIYRGPL